MYNALGIDDEFFIPTQFVEKYFNQIGEHNDDRDNK